MTSAERRQTRLVVGTLLLASVFVAEAAFPGVFRVPAWHDRMVRLGSLIKLGLEASAALLAARNAARFDPGSTARRAWRFLAAAMIAIVLGQLSLAPQQLFGVTATPSLATDVLFLSSYVPLLLALVAFVRAFDDAGLPIGTPTARAAFMGVGILLGSLALAPLLRPLADGHEGPWSVATSLAYPVGDLLVLLVTLALAHVAVRFGGRLRRVWVALLGGVAALAVGDLVSAHVARGVWLAFEPLIDGLFVLGYGFVAVAAVAQRSLIEDEA